MTPTEQLGTDVTGTGASFDSAFDAAFDTSSTAGGDSVSGQQQEAGAEQPSPTSPSPAEAEEVQPVEQQKQPQDGEQPQEQTEEGVTAEGKGYRVGKERFTQFRDAEKAFNEVVKLIPSWLTQGQAPTIQHMRDMRDAASSFRTLQTHYTSGNQQNTSEVLDFLSGTHANNAAAQLQFRQGFARLAEQIPDRLQQIDPQAYAKLQAKFADPDQLRQANPDAFKTVETSVLRSRIDVLYQKALESGNAEDFKNAQWVDHLLTDKYYRSHAEIPRVDPEAQRLKQFAEREKAFNEKTQSFEQQQEQARESTWSQVAANLQASEDSGLSQLTQSALKNAKGAEGLTQETLGAIGSAVAARVREQLKQDWVWSRDREVDLDEMRNGVHTRLKGNQRLADMKPQLDAHIQEFFRVAAPIVRAEVARLVSAKSKQVIAQNGAQTERLQNGQQKRGTAGGGVQTSRPVTNANMTMEQKLDALLAGIK